jgi:hypothetical protein
MDYIDIATKEILIFSFNIIGIIFILTLALDIIAIFFRIIFNVGKKNEKK